MVKENAEPDFRGNITEQLARISDLEYEARRGRYHGYIPEFDINRYLFPATFQSEAGDAKLQLVEDCEALLGKEKMSPGRFNLFVSKMIDILGGKRFTEHGEASNPILDSERGQAISFMRAREDELDFGSIEFGPIWYDKFAYGLQKRVNETGIPAVFRVVTFGYSDYRSLFGSYPVEAEQVCLPNNGVSLEFVLPDERIYNNTLVTPHRITHKALQAICREVFDVFKQKEAAVAA